VWLFAMVQGDSRYLLGGQHVMHQNLGTVFRCHTEAFEHFGGVPREIRPHEDGRARRDG